MKVQTIEYIINKAVQRKVEAYLHKNFPGKTLYRYILIKNSKAEIYGLNGILVKVVTSGKDLFYQIMINK